METMVSVAQLAEHRVVAPGPTRLGVAPAIPEALARGVPAVGMDASRSRSAPPWPETSFLTSHAATLGGRRRRPSRDRDGILRRGPAGEIQGERQRAAPAHRALQSELTAHQLYQPARDRESETRSAVLPCRAAVGLGEALEHGRLALGCDADAGVVHREENGDV